MAALILNFGTRERWVVSHMPWLVYPQGILPVPVEEESGPQNWSGCFGEDQNCYEFNPELTTRSLVIISTMLFQLQETSKV